MVLTLFQATLKIKWLFWQPRNRKVCPVSLIVSIWGIRGSVSKYRKNTAYTTWDKAWDQYSLWLETSDRLQNRHFTFEGFVNQKFFFQSNLICFDNLFFKKAKKTSTLAEMKKSISEKHTFHIFCGNNWELILKVFCLPPKAASWFVLQSPSDTFSWQE